MILVGVYCECIVNWCLVSATCEKGGLGGEMAGR